MSDLDQTIQSSRKPSHRHTFRNFMVLILCAVLLWAWFNYLPQQAIDTLSSLNIRASDRIVMWLSTNNNVPQETINQPIIIKSTSSGQGLLVDMLDETGLSDDVMFSGAMSGGLLDDESKPTLATESGTTLRDEIDAGETMIPEDSTNTGTSVETTDTILPQEPLIQAMNDKIINIEIGGQIITIDGTPEEDVIINAGSYRVIVQKK